MKGVKGFQKGNHPATEFKPGNKVGRQFANDNKVSTVTGHTSINGVTSRTPTYQSFRSMKERCLYTKHQWYHRYGGRGIKIDPRWLLPRVGFKNFLEDVGERPGLDYSLDRWPNRDGNYTKDNCRWATKSEQFNNIEKPFGRRKNGNEYRIRDAA